MRNYIDIIKSAENEVLEEGMTHVATAAALGAAAMGVGTAGTAFVDAINTFEPKAEVQASTGAMQKGAWSVVYFIPNDYGRTFALNGCTYSVQKTDEDDSDDAKYEAKQGMEFVGWKANLGVGESIAAGGYRVTRTG